MSLNLGRGGQYLGIAIALGIVILVAQLFNFALGVVGTILLVAIVILVIAWGLTLLGILE